LGFFISLSIGVATFRANKAIKKLCPGWNKKNPKNNQGFDGEVISSHKGLWFWLMPGYFIPSAFCIVWWIIENVFLEVTYMDFIFRW